MICLAMDTTSKKLALALIVGDETYCRELEVGKSGHSALLLPEIDALLGEHGVTPDMLDAVAVNVGPGSFTGIRIGASAATGLTFDRRAKRIAFTSFDIIAYDRGRTLAAVDAGGGKLYLADCDGGEVKSTRFVEDGESVDGAEFLPLGGYAETLAAVARKKAQSGQFVAVFEPFYMRKSQAEREKHDV